MVKQIIMIARDDDDDALGPFGSSYYLPPHPDHYVRGPGPVSVF